MAPSTEASASRLCGGSLCPSPVGKRRTSSAVRAIYPSPAEPALAAGPLLDLGEATPAHGGATVDNLGGLFGCRSRAQNDCHSASDLRFPHVDNHVEDCESHV